MNRIVKIFDFFLIQNNFPIIILKVREINLYINIFLFLKDSKTMFLLKRIEVILNFKFNLLIFHLYKE